MSVYQPFSSEMAHMRLCLNEFPGSETCFKRLLDIALCSFIHTFMSVYQPFWLEMAHMRLCLNEFLDSENVF